jgi:DNA-directed RNA polymerase specialized sigma subunit
MSSEIKITGTELRAIMDEYKFNDDVMCDDSQKVRVAKMALQKISESDRIIYCLYLDQQSSRKVGKILGVSHSTILKQLQRIRQELLYQIMSIDEDLED